MSPFPRSTGRAAHDHRTASRIAVGTLALLAAIAFVSMATAEEPPAPAVPGPIAPAHPAIGQTFETPAAAAQALCDAYQANDDGALKALMGSGNHDLVADGQEPAVRLRRAALAAAAKEQLSLEKQTDGRVLLVVGPSQYPLPLPLVSQDGTWRFDAAAGRRESLARRIGENEMDAVCICLAYADAQVQYASKDRNGDGVKEYAQLLISTPGAQDGLFWDAAVDQEPSPAGPGLTPLLQALGSEHSAPVPRGGYYWRILTVQGPNAPGGAYSYVIHGRMIAGFALLAVPAEHRKTGVMSFLVSNQGKVYERDLGSDTLKVAAAIRAFDPDPSWREVGDETLREAAADLTGTGEVGLAETPEQAAPGSESDPAVPPAPAPAPAPAPCPERR